MNPLSVINSRLFWILFFSPGIWYRCHSYFSVHKTLSPKHTISRWLCEAHLFRDSCWFHKVPCWCCILLLRIVSWARGLLLTHAAYFRLRIIDGYFVICLIVKKQSHVRPDSIRRDKTGPFSPRGVHLSISKITVDSSWFCGDVKIAVTELCAECSEAQSRGK